MFRPQYGMVVLLVLFLTACSSTAPLDVEPTQKLIIPTETTTPFPQTPTLTLTPLPRASDLSTATPVVEDNATTSSNDPLNDPVAAELVGLAQRRVSESVNLPVRRIQVVEVKSYTWTDTSLGCPNRDSSYPQQEVDGYRIVLSANNQQFIFHTDFDRVVACDKANEKLPTTQEP